MRFTQLGILLNVKDVPLVVACAVPLVITLLAIEVTTAPDIVGLDIVGLVCKTTAPDPVVEAKEEVVTVPGLGAIVLVCKLVYSTHILFVPLGGADVKVKVEPDTE